MELKERNEIKQALKKLLSTGEYSGQEFYITRHKYKIIGCSIYKYSKHFHAPLFISEDCFKTDQLDAIINILGGNENV